MSSPNPPLANLTVVDVAGSVAGAYCAHVFAMLGATVTVVGPDRLPPFQRRFLRWSVHRTVDRAAAVDWSTVDVVIESDGAGPLVPQVFDERRLVHVQLSPFGPSGPYATWSSSDLVDYAISGHAHLYGHPDRAPLPGPPDQPAVACGLFGFIGAMAALFARDRLGHGQVVEVNHLKTMVSLHQVTLLRWMLAGDVLTRMGNRYTGQGQPNGPYRCADGWVSIVGVTDAQVEGLLAVTGLTHLLDHPLIDSPMDLQDHPELLDEPLTAWLREQPVDDVVDLFQAMRIPACPLRSPLELIDDPQLVARNFLQPIDPDDPGSPLVPGTPFTFSHVHPSGGSSWVPGAVDERGPLAGLRVLDLARVWAGPLCARILSDLGADVIWVESPWSRGPQRLPQSFVDAARYFPDDDGGDEPWNRNGHVVKYALGKRSLAIDLQTAEGVAAFEHLLPGAHVLLENFSSRVMPQLGLDENRLHELNPDLVYLTMPGYGRTGPAEHWLAYGSCIDSHAGLSSLIGYPDTVPWKGGVAWPDPIAGLHACSAVLAALWESAHGGSGGCTIEAAQFESTIAAIGDCVLEAQTGDPYDPAGRRGAALVDGMFRCAGDDEWIAVTVRDRAGAHAVRALGVEHGVVEPLDDSVDLAEVLSKLAVGHDAAALAGLLQRAGVAAGPVQKAPGVMADVQLAHGDAWVRVDQPAIGPFTTTITPIALSHTPARVSSAAPTLGQHNVEILTEAGLDVDEVQRLIDAGTIVDRPPG